MEIERHNEDRRRHKRAARKILRAIAEDQEKDDKVRVAAGAALLSAPGWVANLLSLAKKAKDIT